MSLTHHHKPTSLVEPGESWGATAYGSSGGFGVHPGCFELGRGLAVFKPVDGSFSELRSTRKKLSAPIPPDECARTTKRIRAGLSTSSTVVVIDTFRSSFLSGDKADRRSVVNNSPRLARRFAGSIETQNYEINLTCQPPIGLLEMQRRRRKGNLVLTGSISSGNFEGNPAVDHQPVHGSGKIKVSCIRHILGVGFRGNRFQTRACNTPRGLWRSTAGLSSRP